jgi:L-rhamnonate dehydratase
VTARWNGTPRTSSWSSSTHAGCAAERFAHVECFHDHVRVERMLFDGVASLEGERLVAGGGPGHGLSLRYSG